MSPLRLTEHRIASLAPELVTDEMLAAAWRELEQLHHVGISHGNLDGFRVLVDDDGDVAFDDFSAAVATGEQYWCDRDDAALLAVDGATRG